MKTSLLFLVAPRPPPPPSTLRILRSSCTPARSSSSSHVASCAFFVISIFWVGLRPFAVTSPSGSPWDYSPFLTPLLAVPRRSAARGRSYAQLSHRPGASTQLRAPTSWITIGYLRGNGPCRTYHVMVQSYAGFSALSTSPRMNGQKPFHCPPCVCWQAPLHAPTTPYVLHFSFEPDPFPGTYLTWRPPVVSLRDRVPGSPCP